VSYDSKADTLEHIFSVMGFLEAFSHEIQVRGLEHDTSKLKSPEKEAFDEFTPLLKSLTYGSAEYRETLRKMKPAIEHHYKNNTHHPEHYGEDGIRGMSLIDLIEMLCDWKAAGQRHTDDKGLIHSIEVNQKRFGYSDELKQILLNTAAEILGD
jgi:uncharacterized protein DUF5662